MEDLVEEDIFGGALALVLAIAVAPALLVLLEHWLVDHHVIASFAILLEELVDQSSLGLPGLVGLLALLVDQVQDVFWHSSCIAHLLELSGFAMVSGIQISWTRGVMWNVHGGTANCFVFNVTMPH